MKKRLFALFLTAVALTVLAGCHRSTLAITSDAVEDAVETRLDHIEEKVEAKLDVIEDNAEQKVIIPEIPVPLAEAPQSPKPTLPPETDIPSKAPKPDKAAEAISQDQLSREEAERIALDHAGLTGAEVTRLHAEYDVDDGVPEYEVEFYVGRFEYHYEIHAATGAILKAEKEVDD